jgi:hypothetical protein
VTTGIVRSGAYNRNLTMVDIFTVADNNNAPVQAAYDALISRLNINDGALIKKFAEWVKSTGLISINTRLYVVVELINGNSYQNAYDWAEENAKLSGRSVEDLLRERLGDYYERRISFDSEFEKGTTFRYGALNAGGIGASDYGAYCIVLSRAYQRDLQGFVCISGDSLHLCTRNDGSFDVTIIDDRIAGRDYAHMLVANERADKIADVDESHWQRLVLSESDFFEIIFTGDITLNAIESVRVSHDEYAAKWDLTFLNLGVKRTESERALVSDFLQLRRAQVEGRVNVEVVAD